MGELVDFLAGVSGQWLYWVVFLIAFLETSAFVGLLVPGETAVVLAGALASQGKIGLGTLMIYVGTAAVLGDTVSYILGAKLGRAFIMRHPRLFRVRPRHLEKADRYFERHGGKTVFFGRWVGFLRSLAPFLAGSARMPYLRFLAYDLAGCITWAVVVSGLGYAFGKSYRLVEKWLGRVSLFLLLAAVAGFLLWLFGHWLWRRRAALGGLVEKLADAILDWGPLLRFRFRFARQITWLANRFSLSSAFGLVLTSGLLVAALLTWAFAVLVEDVIARQPLTAMDRLVALTLHQHALPWLTRLMVAVTFLGSTYCIVGFAIMGGLILWWRRRRGEAIMLLASSLGASLLGIVLKVLIQRPRPDLVEPLVDIGGYSFPSGHATGAAALYLTLGLLATGWVHRWETRVYVLLAATTVALLIGFSRLYLGVHYLSDVLAGYTVGVLWATLSITAATVYSRARYANRALAGGEETVKCTSAGGRRG